MAFRETGSMLNILISRIAGEKLRDYSFILMGWKEIVGRQVSQKAKPRKYENGILKVSVQNNIWLQELILYKHKIRAQYKKKYGIEIKDIIFYLKTE